MEDHGAGAPAARRSRPCGITQLDFRAADLRADFLFIAIYWNNHHHMFRATRRISGGVMWANFHLLFWLSLLPLVTAWVGAHGPSRWPAVTYGAVSFLAGIAFFILTVTIRNVNKDTNIDKLLGGDSKGKLSMALYALGIALSFIGPLLGYGMYAVVAIMWIMPDRRFANSGDDLSR
jgi:uncharacterized membrane protein